MICGQGGHKMTASQASKEILKEVIECGLLSWADRHSWFLETEKLTDEDQNEINEHIAKKAQRLLKILARGDA